MIAKQNSVLNRFVTPFFSKSTRQWLDFVVWIVPGSSCFAGTITPWKNPECNCGHKWNWIVRFLHRVRSLKNWWKAWTKQLTCWDMRSSGVISTKRRDGMVGFSTEHSISCYFGGHALVNASTPAPQNKMQSIRERRITFINDTGPEQWSGFFRC